MRTRTTRKAKNFKLKQMKDPPLELVKVWPKMNPTKKQQVSRHTERELKLGFKLPMQKNSFFKRLVIALIILVPLVIALIKSKCKESEAETGTDNQQGKCRL